MSGYVETPTRTFVNSAALAADRRVKRSSSTALAYAGQMDRGLGTLESDAFAVTGGVPVAVRLRNAEGTRRGIAAGALSAGDVIYAAANGKLDDVGFIKEGIALSDASADGDVIEYMPCFDDDEHENAETLAAAGSSNTDATLVTHRNMISTGGDGSVGHILPAPTKAGVKISIYNSASGSVKLYPHAGGNINSATTTSGSITLASHKAAYLTSLDGTTWSAVYA
jgi:hypothetical protein